MMLFTVLLLNIWIISLSSHQDDSGCAEDVNFPKTVLMADSVCGPTAISRLDVDFYQLAVDTALAVASKKQFNVFGALLFLNVIDNVNTATGVTEAAEGWQQALNEQYNQLLRCMDSRINNYRQSTVESEWRGFMVGYQLAIGRLQVGGSTDEVRDEINRLFDQMNMRMETDFGTLQSENEYLIAEALLPALKVVAEVYWLTFITHLTYVAEDVANDDWGKYEATDYNYELSVGRYSLKKMKDWCHNALEVIGIMYEPTYKTSGGWDPNDANYDLDWKIKWEKGDTKTSGKCSRHTCADCFEVRITDEYNTYINSIKSDYVDLFDKLYRNSYLIRDYGLESYLQVTTEGQWFGCDNIVYSGNRDIESVTSFCDEDVNCIGFSWNFKGGAVMKKDGGSCYEYGISTDSVNPWVSIFKETQPLCYQRIFTGEFPDCYTENNNYEVCKSESYFNVCKRCDDDPQCLGFRWSELTQIGCTFSETCLSAYSGFFYPDLGFDYYGKCSRLKVEYPRTGTRKCYKLLFLHEFPDCFTGGNNYEVCKSESLSDVKTRCDADPKCLGYRWLANSLKESLGCTFNETCLSVYSGVFYPDGLWSYYGKCSRLDVDYTRIERSGCSSIAADEYRIISDRVYACSGTIASGGVLGEKAAALCGNEYKVCKSAIELEQKGVTEDICSAIQRTTSSQFFATQESSGGYGQCASQNPSNVGTDDVWGCKRSSVYLTNRCGVLNGVLQNRNWNSWDLSAGTTSNEAATYKLTSAASGGVLCCKDEGVILSPLCYEPLFVGKYLDCVKVVINALSRDVYNIMYEYCLTESYLDISRICDNDYRCIGFRWSQSEGRGCIVMEKCVTVEGVGELVAGSGWTYYGMCSRSDIDYPSVSSGFSVHNKMFIVTSGLVVGFMLIVTYLLFITQRLHQNKIFEQIPYSIESDDETDL